jgi:hypothetical protein
LEEEAALQCPDEHQREAEYCGEYKVEHEDECEEECQDEAEYDAANGELQILLRFGSKTFIKSVAVRKSTFGNRFNGKAQQ